MKSFIDNAMYSLFLVATGNLIVFLMVKQGWITDPGWWSVLAWFLTILIGNYFIDKHDEYLLKKKIQGIVKVIALKKGIDPKTIKKEDIRIKSIDKDGNVKVELRVKDKGAQDK